MVAVNTPVSSTRDNQAQAGGEECPADITKRDGDNVWREVIGGEYFGVDSDQ